MDIKCERARERRKGGVRAADLMEVGWGWRGCRAGDGDAE